MSASGTLERVRATLLGLERGAPLRERHESLWPAPHVQDAAVSFCVHQGRGVFCVSPEAGVALPHDDGRC